MAILYVEENQMWVLRTRRSDYAFGVDSFGRLQHLHWGGKQGNISDFPHPDDLQKWVWEAQEGNSREEIMPWGGYAFTEPGLKMTFADGVRDLKLQYIQYEVEGDDKLILTLKDAREPLIVKLVYRVLEEYDLIERHVDIYNDGDKPVSLESVMGAVWHFPIHPDYRLSYLAGHWGAETQLLREPVLQGKKVLESRRGQTSHQCNPWFAIDFGEAVEESGEVYYGGVSFSGHWKITVERTPYQTLQINAGLNDFDFTWQLDPGEVFTSPICVGGYSNAGFGDASWNLHAYQKSELLQKSNELRPVLYNSWEATMFDVNEKSQMQLAEKAAAIGVELFVIDDGWFGQRNDDKVGLGDWYVNPVKFPDGLRPLIDRVQSLGMKFGIWVEPEMVNADSDLYRRHPEWIYHFPGRPFTEMRNQRVLNVAREDVQNYIFTFMDRLLTENDISFVKWDMNRNFTEPGWPERPHDKQKEIWVRHVQGLYSILRRLREKHPGVSFESCSGGGGRIDMGIMPYVEQFWTSDNTDPFDRLAIQEGYSYAYNTKAMMAWVTDVPNYVNGRTTTLRYRFHSAMMGSLGIGVDLNAFSTTELEEASAYIKQYKTIRETIQDGRLFRLMSPRSKLGTAVQYVNESRSQSALFVFLHAQRFRHPFMPVRLRGLDPEALYYSAELNEERSGRSLMTIGVRPDLKADYDSQLIVWNKKE